MFPVLYLSLYLNLETTLETLTNEAFVKDALVKAGLNPSKTYVKLQQVRLLL